MAKIDMEQKDQLYHKENTMKKMKEELTMYVDYYSGQIRRTRLFWPGRRNIIWNWAGWGKAIPTQNWWNLMRYLNSFRKSKYWKTVWMAFKRSWVGWNNKVIWTQGYRQKISRKLNRKSWWRIVQTLPRRIFSSAMPTPSSKNSLTPLSKSFLTQTFSREER